MTEGTQRRLTTIVAADIAGFSRLVGNDEEGTLAAQRNLRTELIEPLLAEHHGRIANTAGDSFLIEFPSAVEAVRFAMAVQNGMAERNYDVPIEQRIEYRIGINVGDVMTDGDDLLGDSVNVAARLEMLADPGRICVSRSVRDQVRDRMGITLEDLGEIAVKNIFRPVRVFRIATTGNLAERPPNEPADGRDSNSRQTQRGSSNQANLENFSFDLPTRPSIAILPFDNLSANSDQDYLGDALSETIIAVLATVPDLLVIARNSSFTYKGKPTKVQHIAEELSVRYVLEGSVQTAGKKIRVTVQLVDALNGLHVWSERYDRDLDNLFELQDDIADRIAFSMDVHLTRGVETQFWRNASADPETYRLCMQAVSAMEQATEEGHYNAEGFLRRAMARDPDGAITNLWLGYLYWQKLSGGLSEDPTADISEARKYALRSFEVNESADAHALLAVLDLYELDHASAVTHADRAIELAPGGAGTSTLIAGMVKADSGQPDKGLAILLRAMRVNPHYPSLYAINASRAHLMLCQLEESRAIATAVASSDEIGHAVPSWALQHLIVNAVWRGDIAEAQTHGKRLLASHSNCTVEAVRQYFYTLKDQDFAERYYDALRRSGVPDQ
jgi:adenylate cyclase